MEQIGKYEVVQKIGSGGFGVVYEGRDPFIERRVAIKTCEADGENIRERFFREAEIAGNLRHPNIVTVHDFGVGVGDGVPFLVQEYLDGEDLASVIEKRQPLSFRDKADILAQVADGLDYAHREGVIHRDVKPANMRRTEQGVVKVMDFGIAKLSNVASHLTKAGMTVGTAAFLPPEQIRGGSVDHRADLFSFGILAYELLTYERPFQGKSISTLFSEIMYSEPTPLTEHVPGCPAPLVEIVERCLRKKPEDRYPGFTPIVESLHAFLETADARPSSAVTLELDDEEPEAPSETAPAQAAAPTPELAHTVQVKADPYVDDTLSTIEALIAAGDEDTALAALRRLVETRPTAIKAHELLARLESGQYTPAPREEPASVEPLAPPASPPAAPPPVPAAPVVEPDPEPDAATFIDLPSHPAEAPPLPEPVAAPPSPAASPQAGTSTPPVPYPAPNAAASGRPAWVLPVIIGGGLGLVVLAIVLLVLL